MKYKFSKLNFLSVLAFLVVLSEGCVKEFKQTYTDFSTTQDAIILQGSGLASFNNANVVIGPSTPDTVNLTVTVALSSTNASASDVAVTLGVDDAKRTAYLTANPNAPAYLAFTSDMYQLVDTKVVVKAGQHYVTTTLRIFKAKVDVSKSWMLPISIMDGSGRLLTGNLNTSYYHIIGNPWAGNYTVTGTRANYSGSSATGTPSITVLSGTKTALPVSATTIAIDYANLGGSGWQYLVTFNGGYTAVTDVSANDVMSAGITAGSFVITAPWAFDPVAKKITVHTSYVNSAGALRIVDEVWVKQ